MSHPVDDPSIPDATLWRRRMLGLAALLGLAAAAIDGYLLVHALRESGRPLGCGAGSGCDAVLQSRWSRIGPVPVVLPSLATHLTLVVAALAAALDPRASQSRTVRWTLLAAAGATTTAAVWFLGVQWLDLKAVCPWCLADHALGVTSSLLIAAAAPLVLLRRVPPFALGALLVGLAAAIQIAFPSPGPGAARLAAGISRDTGPGPDRLVSVLDGRLQVRAHDVPLLGSADAPHVVIVLFDYCCPHCRETHGHLREALARHPDQLGIALLPMPLNTDCNRGEEETEPRFEASCDLARLALAVWRADRAKFPEYDAWLFEPEQPRTAAEAHDQAEQLVGRAALDATLSDPWIEQQIAADVEAYIAGATGVIPVLLSPEIDAVVGRPSSRDELFSLLERELSLTAK
jgi:uncharacterized membrane protein